jgi:excinuclease UvrABC ATPase subunit
VPGYTADGWMVKGFAESGFVDPDKPIADYSEQELHDLLYKETTKVKIAGINMTYEGLVPKVTKSMLQKDRDSLQPHVRAFVDRAVKFMPCPACAARASMTGALVEDRRGQHRGCRGHADHGSRRLGAVHRRPARRSLLQTLQQTLDSFVDIGLGYLSLDRASGTLSGEKLSARR